MHCQRAKNVNIKGVYIIYKLCTVLKGAVYKAGNMLAYTAGHLVAYKAGHLVAYKATHASI